MAAVLRDFTSWATSHVGRGCPTIADISKTTTDGWGHPLKLTCKDQPDTQQIGLVSAGRDGKLDNGDDIKSWSADASLMAIAPGPRWTKPITKPASVIAGGSTATGAAPAKKPDTKKSTTTTTKPQKPADDPLGSRR
jgi:hypothetical protein